MEALKNLYEIISEVKRNGWAFVPVCHLKSVYALAEVAGLVLNGGLYDADNQRKVVYIDKKR